MLSTPVEVAVVEEVAWHAEHAGRFRFPLDRLEALAAVALPESEEFRRIGAGSV